jgi:hypothetical protein
MPVSTSRPAAFGRLHRRRELDDAQAVVGSAVEDREIAVKYVILFCALPFSCTGIGGATDQAVQ